nr:hypothetical protein B11C_110083 [Bartonella sp. 1-1C]
MYISLKRPIILISNLFNKINRMLFSFCGFNGQPHHQPSIIKNVTNIMQKTLIVTIRVTVKAFTPNKYTLKRSQYMTSENKWYYFLRHYSSIQKKRIIKQPQCIDTIS